MTLIHIYVFVYSSFIIISQSRDVKGLFISKAPYCWHSSERLVLVEALEPHKTRSIYPSNPTAVFLSIQVDGQTNRNMHIIYVITVRYIYIYIYTCIIYLCYIVRRYNVNGSPERNNIQVVSNHQRFSWKWPKDHTPMVCRYVQRPEGWTVDGGVSWNSRKRCVTKEMPWSKIRNLFFPV